MDARGRLVCAWLADAGKLTHTEPEKFIPQNGDCGILGLNGNRRFSSLNAALVTEPEGAAERFFPRSV